MHPQNDDNASRIVERKLYDANQALNQLIAQSPEEVREMQAMFGSTPCELPENLRDAKDVLERIVESDNASRLPSAFGKLVLLMRTEKRLTLEQLAEKTDLDVNELQEIESCPDNIPEPMAVSVLADFFKLAPKKLQQLAGLALESSGGEIAESLGIAAGAKPEYGELSKQDRKLFHQWVKHLRK